MWMSLIFIGHLPEGNNISLAYSSAGRPCSVNDSIHARHWTLVHISVAVKVAIRMLILGIYVGKVVSKYPITMGVATL